MDSGPGAPSIEHDAEPEAQSSVGGGPAVRRQPVGFGPGGGVVMLHEHQVAEQAAQEEEQSDELRPLHRLSFCAELQQLEAANTP